MAKFVIYRPAYVGGLYYGGTASVSTPVEVDFPDTVVPSLSWDPVDQAALKAYDALIEKKFVAPAIEGKNPQQASEIRASLFKKHRKALVTPPEVKEAKEDMPSNSDLAAKGSKVVGRMSDRSPV